MLKLILNKMSYHGKVIYNPSGKAGEYSYWAANFYNGCSAMCEYCYNRKGITAKVLGGDEPVLKKSLISERNALMILDKEILLNLPELRKHGLFFNFVSDPCLKETIRVNQCAWGICLSYDIPVKILTKQTWWIDEFIELNKDCKKELIAIGLTITGFDDLEPGAATNIQRIDGAKRLHQAGFKTFGSFEPIRDLDITYKMILLTLRHDCIDLYKIGLEGGKKYDKGKILTFLSNCLLMLGDKKIYFKDSLLKAAGISRETLPDNCVTRDFNL
jgi:hypothetical protein